MSASGSWLHLDYCGTTLADIAWGIGFIALALTGQFAVAAHSSRGLFALVLVAIGGPLAYLSGAKLGAATLPSANGLFILGITWAGACKA